MKLVFETSQPFDHGICNVLLIEKTNMRSPKKSFPVLVVIVFVGPFNEVIVDNNNGFDRRLSE